MNDLTRYIHTAKGKIKEVLHGLDPIMIEPISEEILIRHIGFLFSDEKALKMLAIHTLADRLKIIDAKMTTLREEEEKLNVSQSNETTTSQ